MIIFHNIILRLVRRPVMLILLILFPIIFGWVISIFFGAENNKISVGIIDNDKTILTENLIETLSKNAHVKIINNDGIKNKILQQEIKVGFIIEKGTTKDIINGKDISIESYSIEDSNIAMPVTVEINSYINTAVAIAKEANGNEDHFYNRMDVYNKQIFSSEFENIISKSEEKNDFAGMQVGFLVMGMLYLSTLSTTVLAKDRRNKIFYRVISGPIKMPAYMIQSICSFFVIAAIQVFVIFAFFSFIMGYHFNGNTHYMILLSLIFALVCVAFGVAVNSISKDERQSGIVMSLVITPMALLGGCLFPKEAIDGVLEKIGAFFPTTWIMNAFTEIINGKSISSTYDDIAILFVFILIFSLFASWRKADIAK